MSLRAVAHRLAGVARLELRELVGMIEQRQAILQDAAALGRGHAAPGAVERAARGRHREVHLVRAAAGDGAKVSPLRRR